MCVKDYFLYFVENSLSLDNRILKIMRCKDIRSSTEKLFSAIMAIKCPLNNNLIGINILSSVIYTNSTISSQKKGNTKNYFNRIHAILFIFLEEEAI